MTPELIVATAGAFVSVWLLVAAALTWLLSKQSPARRRLQQLAGQGAIIAAGRPLAPPVLVDEPDPRALRLSRLVPKSPATMSRLERRLARAGFHSTWAPIVYSAFEAGLPVLFAAAAILRFGWPGGLIPAAFVATLGYLLPGVLLAWRVEKRRTLLRNALPDGLDLLIVCVEAGLSLDQAIQKASEEIELAHPVLAHELRTIMSEIRAGMPRLEAMKHFAQRTKVEDVQSLVALLVQTDRFGTSIAQALRTFAETARTKRRQRAEEKAQKLGVKLVFPLVFCLFPALYVVTLGPSVIQFVRVFFGVVARP
jgi:tight adherence protein C